jgi:lipopolysaccharide export system protein LptC
MSVLADAERSKRQLWAATGGSHDRLVRALQVILPSLVGALAAVLLFAPFSQRNEIGFLLAKDAIEVSPQRLRVDAARYTGSDALGRPFSLSAASAVQRSSADPVVRLSDLSAMIVMADGPATLDADSGRYDPTADTVAIDGPLRFVAADGYRLDTANVAFDMKTRRLSSGQRVTGNLPIGTFSADRLSADLDARIVRLSGNARLRINQGLNR